MERCRISAYVGKDAIDKARRAAYWIPGETVSGIIEAGIAREVARLERKHGRVNPIPDGKQLARKPKRTRDMPKN